MDRLPAAACCWLLLPLVLLAGGCSETEQITRYAVSKEAATPTAGGDEIRPLQTQPTSAWFYKLTGPADTVATIEEEFRALVESTSIDGGEPTWTLPEGWTRQPGGGFRFATLTIDDADPPLEVSVSQLPYRGDRNSYLRDNINRWRGQVGLAPATDADWMDQARAAGEIEPLQAEGRDTTLIDLTGQTSEIPEARMLAAILLPAGAGSATTPPAAAMTPSAGATPPAEGGPLKYEVPEGWEPGEMSVMRVAAFQVTDGEKNVEVTIIPAGGDVRSNVNLWRGQVGLGEWSEDELKQATQELTIDGKPATYIELTGDDESILGAILPGEPQSWFFKLKGDTDLAQREADRFKAFVESVTFQ